MFLGDAQLQKEWITSQQPQEAHPESSGWDVLGVVRPLPVPPGEALTFLGTGSRPPPGVQILGLSPHLTSQQRGPEPTA